MNYNFYKFAQVLVKLFVYSFFEVKVYNKPELSDDGLVIVPNHISALDPLIIASVFDDPVYYLGKEELFENTFTNKLISSLGAIPINRDKPALSSMREVLSLLKNKKKICVFMEGTRVKEFDINNAKSGVALLAVKGKADILPIRIKSTYKIFSTVEVHFREKIKREDIDINEDYSYKDLAEDTLKKIYGKE